MLIVLDSGPLGLLANPAPRGAAHDAQSWAWTHVSAGTRIVVPAIADYEVRRELLRAGKELGIARLNELCDGLGYRPLTTSIMRSAADLWARARNDGYPTAHDAALDGDVILAAQVQDLRADEPSEPVVVATTNVSRLERYVEAVLWTQV